LAGRDDIAAGYAAASGADLSALEWYEVLACFKLGVILEGTFARACAGLVPLEVGDKLHRGALALFERALEMAKTRR
jgi:aminoglycoside phosphotransferase (APT) family kinase protein